MSIKHEAGLFACFTCMHACRQTHRSVLEFRRRCVFAFLSVLRLGSGSDCGLRTADCGTLKIFRFGRIILSRWLSVALGGYGYGYFFFFLSCLLPLCLRHRISLSCSVMSRHRLGHLWSRLPRLEWSGGRDRVE